MKDKLQMLIACALVLGIFGLLVGCQTTGKLTRDHMYDPYNVEGTKIEKG